MHFGLINGCCVHDSERHKWMIFKLQFDKKIDLWNSFILNNSFIFELIKTTRLNNLVYVLSIRLVYVEKRMKTLAILLHLIKHRSIREPNCYNNSVNIPLSILLSFKLNIMSFLHNILISRAICVLYQLIISYTTWYQSSKQAVGSLYFLTNITNCYGHRFFSIIYHLSQNCL